MTKTVWIVVAAVLLAIVAVAGYFLIGPGSDGGYGSDYNVTETDGNFNYRGGY